LIKEEEKKKEESLRYFKEAYSAHMGGKIEEAILLYQKSIKVFPTAEAMTFLGWALSFLGRYEDAIGYCKEAIKIDPDLGNPYNDIGAYLIELDRLDEAIPFLEKASTAKRYDNFCYPHYNLGRVWEKKGMIKKAMQSYQRALEENPEYAVATESLEILKNKLN